MNHIGARAVSRPWVERFARTGYVAKGVVYILIGSIALRAALGDGRAENTSGSLAEARALPLGAPLLVAIGAGLLAYAAWLAYRTLANPERDSAGKRVSLAFLTLVNAGIALEALRLGMSGVSGGGGDARTDHWTARALSQPLGAWLTAMIGVGVAVYGLRQLRRGFRSDLDDRLRLPPMPPGRRAFLVNAARAGLAARGVVFVVIGWFLGQAALHANAGEATDLGGALRSLQGQPYGSALLAVVGVGLAGYDVYELLRARYRVIS